MDLYTTRTLVKAIQGMDRPASFLADRYFPTNDATDIFATEKVLVEKRRGNRTLAPFVSRNGAPVATGRQGQEMVEYVPPTVAPSRMLTVDDISKRGFGESIMPQLAPESRAAQMALRDLDELDSMIARREEQMAAEVMTTNGCVMKSMADSLSETVTDEVKFYDGTNDATVAFEKSWDAPDAPILKYLGDMVRAQSQKGQRVSDLVCAPDAADAILANAEVQQMLDNRRINIGEAAPKLEADGAAVVCTLNILGRMIDVISYDETYVDADGDVRQYMPEGTVVLTAPGAGMKLYGAVTQIEDNGEFRTWARRRVPRVLVEKRNNNRELVLTSRPLLVPADARPFLAGKAVFDA